MLVYVARSGQRGAKDCYTLLDSSSSCVDPDAVAVPRVVVAAHHIVPGRSGRQSPDAILDPSTMILQVRAHDLNFDRVDVSTGRDAAPRNARYGKWI